MYNHAKTLIDIVRKSSPSALKLALLVSLATRIEPELLRAMRLHHLPDVDAGAEADLWFSPLISASSPLGIAFRADVLSELRKQLAAKENTDLLQKAWSTLQIIHKFAPPSIKFEEKVTYLSLSGASKEVIDKELMPAVSALFERNSEGNDERIARWARRMLPRLPENVRETRAASILDIGVSNKLRKQLIFGNYSLEDFLVVKRLELSNMEQTLVGVRLINLNRTAKWEFSQPPIIPSTNIKSPMIDPIVIEMSWNSKNGAQITKQIILPMNNSVTAPNPGTEVTIRTGVGISYIFEPITLKDQGIDRPLISSKVPDGFKLRQSIQSPKGSISQASWSPDGKYIAFSTLGGTIHIWDLNKGNEISQLLGHKSNITCLSWSPDGQILATGSEDNTLCLWDLSKGILIKTIRGHSNGVSCLSWSKDGILLASGSYDKTIRLWDAKSYELLRILSEHEDWVRDLAWSPDGNFLASCGDDQQIYLWKADDFERPQTLSGHKGSVLCLAWSPDGRYLVSGSEDQTISVWDLESSKYIQVIENVGVIRRISFSSDGKMLLSRSSDNVICLWRTDTWELRATFLAGAANNESSFLALHSYLPTLAIPGEKDNIIHIWDLDENLLLFGEGDRYKTNKLEEEDWKLLLQRIKDGKCTPFLGAGVCAGKIPFGSQIASEWAKKYDYPMEDSYDLTRVAQFVAVTIDVMTPNEEMCKKINQLSKEITPNYFEIPDEPHGMLADLPLPVYITTNYDDLLEQALRSRGKVPVQEICRWSKRLKKSKRKSSDYDPTPEKPLVYHLYGTYKEPESLVLTEADYLNFLVAISKEQNLLPPSIQEAISGSSLLFLGYNIDDFNNGLFWFFAKYLEVSSRRKHYSVQLVPENVSEAQKEKAQKYLDLYFSELNIQVYWQDCRKFAAELRTRWEAFNRGT